MSVEVKICGLRRAEDIRAVNLLRPEYAGFVFHEKSKRNVDFGEAGVLLAMLDAGIKSVAVCVSPDVEKVRVLDGMGFDVIQIHGKLPIDALEGLRAGVWQAVNISSAEDFMGIIRHPQISGYVVDGAAWGSGVTFGWEDEEKARELSENIRRVVGDKKFVLAGGLSPDNVAQGIALMHPDAVDVSSGVEIDGFKDYGLIKNFINEVRLT